MYLVAPSGGGADVSQSDGSSITLENLLAPLPADLQEAAAREATARDLLPGEVRWLVALLVDDPLTPAPAAAAIVERVASGPMGPSLARLERDLMALPPAPERLLPGERRGLSIILTDLRRRVDERLAQLDTG